MNEITIIIGAQETGKTRTARKIIQGRKSIELDGSQMVNGKDKFYFGYVEDDTEVILIDDCVYSDYLKDLIYGNDIIVERCGKDRKIIPTPDLIIITDVETVLVMEKFRKRENIQILKLI